MADWYYQPMGFDCGMDHIDFLEISSLRTVGKYAV